MTAAPVLVPRERVSLDDLRWEPSRKLIGYPQGMRLTLGGVALVRVFYSKSQAGWRWAVLSGRPMGLAADTRMNKGQADIRKAMAEAERFVRRNLDRGRIHGPGAWASNPEVKSLGG